MNHFDNLPRQDRNHVVEDEALAAFERQVLASGAFTVQGPDRKDYGSDCQLEVAIDGGMTNIRVHVQVKGTEKPLRADGSVSIDVTKANLNYLAMNPYSFYVCFHLPSRSLFICSAEAVIRRYEHGKVDWTKQKTVSVVFTEILTVDRLKSVAALARSNASAERTRRESQAAADPAELSARLRRSVPDLYIPDDGDAAFRLLGQLFSDGADDVIAAAFEKFSALFGPDHDRMGHCYMAEINLGLDGNGSSSPRIREAISYFRRRLDDGRLMSSAVRYNIGNAFVALGEDANARIEYEAAMADPKLMAMPDLSSWLYKNLGTCLSRLGESEAGVACYREALRRNSSLPEAHVAMGHHHMRLGEFDTALEHFDKVMTGDGSRGKLLQVAGWRINTLFNLGEGRSAFREIGTLLTEAAAHPWIWPWCRRQVGSFGRASQSNARLSLTFWRFYLLTHPDDVGARVELLSATLYLSMTHHDLESTYEDCRTELEAVAEHCGDDGAAYLWDRLGHWAEREDDLDEAERCYRRAYDLADGEYGYCLAVVLNALGRFEESLPLLQQQAHDIQPDAQSWCELAIAYEHLDEPLEAMAAYFRAMELDPAHAAAVFNLGGLLWNTGLPEVALEVWKVAVARFPEDSRVEQVNLRVQAMLMEAE
ncbi:DUF4365 domain-containing protein [Novosphingobium terrae]|uniref:DUF4365 domain-containing protein n=1 Tax=Novosphingobium terrae TaxID=2726189 RepID=UPI00197E7EF3|nr:DUF4365 domain-containing protein [Novosphingobium terrae]